ncbi:MAG: hypothetical protein ACRED4_07795, partial [Brevundimonas sp.]
MKKLLVAGAAVAALLSAGSANADDIYNWSMAGTININPPGPGSFNLSGTVNNTEVGGVPFIGGLLEAFTESSVIPAIQSNGVNSNVSLITLSGHSAANNGTAQSSTSNTFTLEGDVTPDCSF